MDNKAKLEYLNLLEEKVKSAAKFIQDEDWGAAFKQVLKSEREALSKVIPLEGDEILPNRIL